MKGNGAVKAMFCLLASLYGKKVLVREDCSLGERPMDVGDPYRDERKAFRAC